jgi:hypothetical protein
LAIDRVLFYGNGGGAWVDSNNLTPLDVPTGATVSFSNNNNKGGWWGRRVGFYLKLDSEVGLQLRGAEQLLLYCSRWFYSCWRRIFHAQSQYQTVAVGTNYLFNVRNRYWRGST